MGSRAVVVVCRDEDAVRRRFGVVEQGRGIVYTRTGRRFFEHAELETALLARVAGALDASGLWAELESDWAILDCELLPWSAKARDLLRQQYAAVPQALSSLRAASERGVDLGDLAAHYAERAALLERYVNSCRRYCWPVASLDDFRLAPFHLLASEGAVHVDRDHGWHMETLARLCAADPSLLLATPYLVVDVADEASRARGAAWWEERTERGGEGMVVKPRAFIASGRRGPAQPAVKCRGREYLRIIVWAGVHHAGAPGAAVRPRAGRQAVAGAARIRAGHRGTGTLRARRAAAPRTRVRLRRAGAGERAGGSKTLRRSSACSSPIMWGTLIRDLPARYALHLLVSWWSM